MSVIFRWGFAMKTCSYSHSPVSSQIMLFHYSFHSRCLSASHTFGGNDLQMCHLRKIRHFLAVIISALRCSSPLPPSQPSSPDKKKPLLRCFVKHYKMVAMDTHSEQAPHTSGRVRNDTCNISHFKTTILCFNARATQ